LSISLLQALLFSDTSLFSLVLGLVLALLGSHKLMLGALFWGHPCDHQRFDRGLDDLVALLEDSQLTRELISVIRSRGEAKSLNQVVNATLE